jgi:Kef-type K+ transport system membrane component KefB
MPHRGSAPALTPASLFVQLAVLVLAALAGPLLAFGRRGWVPVVIGELVAGVVLGTTGFGVVDASVQPLQAFLAIGFAMLMLSAGARIDIGSAAIRHGFLRGLLTFAVVVVLATPAGILVDRALGVGHPALLVTLISGSSAAIAFPIFEERDLQGGDIATLMAWIAVADALTVIVMPLTLAGSTNIVLALLGDAAILAASALILALVPRTLDSRPVRGALQESLRRGWALQVRVSVLVLFGLSAIAQLSGGSTLVAGFAAGLILARLREPPRLVLQLSGLASGFFVPFFFVLLGAELNLRALLDQPSRILLAFALMVAVLVTHVAAASITGRRWAFAGGLGGSAQLGLPAAAASLGLATHVLSSAAAAALVAAGCLTLIPASIGARLLSCRAEARP